MLHNVVEFLVVATNEVGVNLPVAGEARYDVSLDLNDILVHPAHSRDETNWVSVVIGLVEYVVNRVCDRLEDLGAVVFQNPRVRMDRLELRCCVQLRGFFNETNCDGLETTLVLVLA